MLNLLQTPAFLVQIKPKQTLLGIVGYTTSQQVRKIIIPGSTKVCFP